MHDYFLSAIVLLVVIAVGVKSASIFITPFNIPFYKLYNPAESKLAIKQPTTRDRIADHGYPVEHHHIVTEDGYILGVFRIPYSHKLQNEKEYRPIVLIQHGLMGGSDAWVSVGPNDALPYMLVDSGYDVWLGNGRGNTYSRNHTSRSTDKTDFWCFSWHDIGYYDIAATIDFTLKINGQGQKSIHYVGHSQGTTVFFTLMSLRPEYNEKIKTAHMFAPVAIMTHMKNQLVRLLSFFLGHTNIFSVLLSNMEFLPYNRNILTMISNICGHNRLLRPVCVYIVQKFYNGRRWNKTALSEGIGVLPAGCSTNQILHYLQELQSGHFRQYDHGPKKNQEVYRLKHPPDYPVEKISCKVHLWYSDNDVMTSVEDVLAFAKRLPNKELHHIEDPKWDHDDFALNMKLRTYLNEPVIEIISNFEKSLN
ncbi:lipase 3-like isoform X1 [Drosophila novamexicana]|uniref:lipase 3-like isoform X1 n=2 Tax=Drosophila novamexicana TaxID=47314 RepID=UPI0011E5DC23|nr:lipase 3-like isoform X1 [Drosophila novamexicana]